MKVTISNTGEKMQISLSKEYSMADLKEWDVLIYKMLLLLEGQNVSAVTISPQPYSVGLELSNHQKMQRGKFDFLINWGISLSEDIIKLIISSEEFVRGLLFLVSSESVKDIFEIIDAVDSVGSIKFDKFRAGIIVLEDDGKMLTLTNITNERAVAINQLIDGV